MMKSCWRLIVHQCGSQFSDLRLVSCCICRLYVKLVPDRVFLSLEKSEFDQSYLWWWLFLTNFILVTILQFCRWWSLQNFLWQRRRRLSLPSTQQKCLCWTFSYRDLQYTDVGWVQHLHWRYQPKVDLQNSISTRKKTESLGVCGQALWLVWHLRWGTVTVDTPSFLLSKLSTVLWKS